MRSDLVNEDSSDTAKIDTAVGFDSGQPEGESADNTTEFWTYDTDGQGRPHERTPDLHDFPAPFPLQLIAIILVAALLYPRQD